MTAADSLVRLAEEVGAFYADPLGFVKFAFPWAEPGPLEHEAGPDDWQQKFLEDLGAIVRGRHFDGLTPVDPVQMGIASGHGIGKSTLFAWLHWWIMSTRPSAKGRVTANTYTQLETTTWAEIQRWHKLLISRDLFEITGSKAWAKANPEGWFSRPITCAEENSEAFAGQHNKNSTSFFLFDESSLIPDKIWEVAEAGLTDGEPMFFAAGNPTRNTGEFYEINFGAKQHRWDHRSIDSRTCRFPNHALHDEWIQDHGLDSDFVRVRILGLPPKQTEEQLISREVITEAQRRTVYGLENDPLIAGVDVPDGGSAWFVVRFRRGLDSRPGKTIPAPIRIAGSRIDRAEMVSRCAELLFAHGERKVAAMFIDAAFGAAIVERLRSLGFTNVHEISFGGKSPDPNYGNMRAFMWGREMKEWLDKGAIDPEDRKLAADLAGPGFHYRVGGDGALVVESKDDMKARGIPSPDDGDALALTFAQPVAPVQQPRRPPPPRMGGTWL